MPTKTKTATIAKRKTSFITKVIRVFSMKTEIARNEFRVSIFGSARVKKGDRIYKQIYNLAKEIGKNKIDLVTGGGPGLMEAANNGHAHGDKNKKADNIGLTIQLPWENSVNKYVEIQEHFEHFSKRLDNFMALSNAVVVAPGGIGSCLELFYAWQLVQVRHVGPIPLILVGKMWSELIKWVKKYPLKAGLISPIDMNCIYLAKNNKKAMQIILKQRENFQKEKKNSSSNIKKYKLD